MLEIADAIAEPDEELQEGERVVLNILLGATRDILIRASEVEVRVEFFELVNDSMVDPDKDRLEFPMGDGSCELGAAI